MSVTRDEARRANTLRGLVLLLATIAGSSTGAQEAGLTAGVAADREQAAAFSDAVYLKLLGKYATEDGNSVDYAAWQASTKDMQLLDAHIAVIGDVSPGNHPEMFRSRDAERRYWINAYNALVIDAVLDLWPLESVRDVRVSLTSRLVPGKGFFYDREILVGGKMTNLRDLEREVLAGQDDPRLHFALNCASDSCPVLRASDWSEEALEQAARDFINDPANVSVDVRAVHVSRIFKWYRREFPEDLYAYLQQYAAPPLQQQLVGAIEADLPVRYTDYDWSLNASH